jgi:hypothetical protein
MREQIYHSAINAPLDQVQVFLGDGLFSGKAAPANSLAFSNCS